MLQVVSMRTLPQQYVSADDSPSGYPRASQVLHRCFPIGKPKLPCQRRQRKLNAEAGQGWDPHKYKEDVKFHLGL